ncbi:MAG: TonB family protein [Candidatus Obscuribacterales bacterium]
MVRPFSLLATATLCLLVHCQFVQAKAMQKVVVSITQSECPRQRLKEYIAYLEHELNNNWKVNSNSATHTVSVLFAVHPGGEMSALQIQKSSLDRDADQAVLKTVENSRFKEPPSKCGDTIMFKATFESQK